MGSRTLFAESRGLPSFGQTSQHWRKRTHVTGSKLVRVHAGLADLPAKTRGEPCPSGKDALKARDDINPIAREPGIEIWLLTLGAFRTLVGCSQSPMLVVIPWVYCLTSGQVSRASPLSSRGCGHGADMGETTGASSHNRESHADQG